MISVYIAISPSMNVQWSGNVFFSRYAVKPAPPVRSSSQPASPPAALTAPLGAGSTMTSFSRRAAALRGSTRSFADVLIALPVARPHGLGEPLGRDEITRGVDGDLQLRQRALGRAEDDVHVPGGVEGRLVARAEQVVGLLLVQPHGASDVGTDLGVGDDPLVAPLLGLTALLVVGELRRVEAHEDHGGLGLVLEDVRAVLESLGHDVE